ncbi:type IV secretion system protein [Brevundimonas bacteroides]|uniref:type IV secretion system protein n=1 Tax=Brevundimonas bacteroides TaxID=74311 RepID=UPI000B1C950A|nr:type IV secretion system protein [Brevundimonas bacteroides]
MAAPPGMETPNELMVVFSETVSAGFEALQGPVDTMFGLMIALVVALTGIQWALSSNRDLLAAGFGKVLLIGSFAYIINDWQALSETLQAGFIELGLAAGGGALSQSDFLNPGAVLHQGWRIVRALGETPAPVANPLDVAGNLMDALILGLAMIGIMLAFAVLALQIIVTLLEFKIVTLGGFVLLPFGIWSKSAFLAERPLGFVVSSGLKVLALAIVVSGASTVFDQLQPSANPDLYEALAILVAALLLAMLALFVPNLAAALVTGGPALGAGSALTAGLAVAGAGGLVAAGAAGAGAALGGGAARLAGGARAASAAPTGRGPASGPPSPAASGPPRPPSPSGSGHAAPIASRVAPGPGPAGKDQGLPPSTASAGKPTRDAPAGPTGASGTGPQTAGATVRSRASETEAARQAFHRAAGAGPQGGAQGPAPSGVGRAGGARSAAFRSFFVANTARSLLPSSETTGTLSPQLKSEDR